MFSGVLQSWTKLVAKNLKTRSSKMPVYLNLKGCEMYFLGKQDENLLQTCIPPPPPPFNFMLQHCHGGVGMILR